MLMNRRTRMVWWISKQWNNSQREGEAKIWDLVVKHNARLWDNWLSSHRGFTMGRLGSKALFLTQKDINGGLFVIQPWPLGTLSHCFYSKAQLELPVCQGFQMFISLQLNSKIQGLRNSRRILMECCVNGR